MGSEAIFGGINKDHFTGKITEIPLRRKAYWEVDLDAITFGDQSASLDNTGAILDTGTSLIALPSTLAELLNKEMGAKKGYNGQYTVECEKRDSLQICPSLLAATTSPSPHTATFSRFKVLASPASW